MLVEMLAEFSVLFPGEKDILGKLNGDISWLFPVTHKTFSKTLIAMWVLLCILKNKTWVLFTF